MMARADVLGTDSVLLRHAAAAAPYLPLFRASAERHDVPLAVLLGIASHESCMGTCLDASFKGDSGNAWGLMQIDRRYHSAFTSSTDPRDHAGVIDYGAGLLAQYRRELGGNLQHAISAYNSGVAGVRSALASTGNPDARTTPYKQHGVGFSEIVLHRAAWFERAFGLAPVVQPTVAAAGLLAALAAGYLIMQRIYA